MTELELPAGANPADERRPGSRVVGRAKEIAQVHQLLADASTAPSVLLVVGDAGLGKSTLLGEAIARAQQTAIRVLAASGVEAESELAFAGLHQLLRPLLGHLERLPSRQSAALRAAFGLGDEATPDRFLIGLATLTLLADVADQLPVLVVVDDAQWFDRGSLEALAFAVRRLHAERIAILVASRAGELVDPFGPHTPRLTLGPLDEHAANELLDASGRALPSAMRTRVLAEAAGNPLALIELATVATDASDRHLDAAGSPAPLAPTARLERLFSSQLQSIPEPSRRMLLLAASAGGNDIRPVLRAADAMGLSVDALRVAEHAGLLSVRGDEFAFRHPLIRSVLYHLAGFAERQAAHLALAAALQSDPERNAWHLAAVALEPDESIASLLEATADRSRLRGGYAAACSALERAAELSPEPAEQARRLTRATEMAFAAGRTEWVEDIARRVSGLTENPRLRGLADQRVAQIQALSGHGGSVPDALSSAALQAVMAEAPEIGLRRLVVAAGFAFLAGNRELLATAYNLARSVPGQGDEPWRLFVLAAAQPSAHRSLIEAGVRAAIAEPPPSPDIGKMISHVPWFTDDSASAATLLGRAVDDMRTRGDIGALGSYLALLGFTCLWRGRWLDARGIASEAATLATDIDQPNIVALATALDALVTALQGDEAAARKLAASALKLSEAGLAVAVATWALGVLALATGRGAEAYEQLRRIHTAANASSHFAVSAWVVGDLVEAAVQVNARAEVLPIAATALRDAEAGTSVRSLLVARRAQALLEPGDGAGQLFDAALATDGAEQWPFELARTQLSYGEWLRRHRRVTSARPMLRAALDTFNQLGAQPWMERARMELRAAGVALEARPAHAVDELTPQERQIAQLAAQGLTNREIGAQLFLSPRTVGFHLYNVFPKLQVTTRAQLVHALAEPEGV